VSWQTDPQLASERALAGAALTSADLALAVLDQVEPAHLGAQGHQAVLETVADLAGRGEAIAPGVVLSELVRLGKLGVIGGGPYLHSLVEQAALPGQVGYHTRIVKDRKWKQELQLFAGRCAQLATTGTTAPDEDRELLNEWLDRMSAAPGDHGTARAADLVYDVIEEIELGTGEDILRTGFTDLDDSLAIRPGQLVVVGARPGVGKSTIGMDFSRHVGIKLGAPVYFLSLEMSRGELMKRMISAEARVPLHAILHHTQKSPRLVDDDWSRMQAAAERIQQSQIVIDDSSGVGLAHIRARLRHMKRHGGVRLAVIDYLGILATPGKQENRQQSVAELTRGLKQIAREIGIPVVVLAQLNRMVEHRTDRRPMVSDLKDSGAIEADADVVILLHREDVYDKESPRAGEIDLCVDKSRHGPQFTATAAYQGHYCRIMNMAPGVPEPSPAARGQLRPVP
jgi:replicative DNA helicase